MKRQYMNLAFTALLAFGGLVAVLFLARFNFYSDVMMAVFFAGSVGAVVNNYYRLSKISLNQDAVKDLINRPAITIQMYVSLFLSGILGFVIYGLFLSGLLQGEMFPKFEGLKENYVSISEFLNHVAPATNLDIAKALMWAFVAGFSEKFIPNTLDSLVTKALEE